MTLPAFLLILASVFLHAGWNLLLKGGTPSVAANFLRNSSVLLYMLPCLFWCPLPQLALPRGFWLCLAGSIAGELLYNLSLAYGYRLFDLSLFYPLARALPVVMLAIGSFFLPLGRERPGVWAILGMAMVFFGCLYMASQRKVPADTASRRNYLLWFWVLVGATGTCLYTGFDHAGTNLVKESGTLAWGLLPACAYFGLVEVGLTVGNGLIVAFSPDERTNFKKLCGKTCVPLVAGLFDALSYTLVLVAYTKATNASLVFAFRQLGLPVGFLGGMLFFHEKPLLNKWIGLTAIVLGLLVASCD